VTAKAIERLLPGPPEGWLVLGALLATAAIFPQTWTWFGKNEPKIPRSLRLVAGILGMLTVVMSLIPIRAPSEVSSSSDVAEVQAKRQRAAELAVEGERYRHSGREDEARKALYQALGIFESLDDSFGAAMVHLELAICEIVLGDAREAERQLALAEPFIMASGDELLIVKLLVNRGDLEFQYQDYPAAEMIFRDAISRAAAVGDEFGLVGGNDGLGEALFLLGRWVEAEQAYLAALAHAKCDEPVPPIGVAGIHLNLSMVYFKMDRDREGLDQLRMAEDCAARSGDRLAYANVLAESAHIGLLIGMPERALKLAEDALREARSAGAEQTEAAALALTGWAMAELGRAGEAEATLREAIRLAGETNDELTEAIAYMELGKLVEQRNREEGLGYLYLAREIYIARGLTSDVEIVDSTIASLRSVD
jgi:tetratricopeptide (TPR) repeat protein